MRTWLSYLYGYTLAPHEAAAARHGFMAFGLVLSSYFILLPLREDVALTLGPSLLPRLFIASLVVTAVVAPLVTAYVINPTTGSRAAGFRRLCHVMAGCLLGLWVLLLLTSPDPWVAARILMLARPGPKLQVGADGPPPPGPVVPPPYSRYGNAVRVCFYVYLSLQSLLSTSSLWAVCSDHFTAASSTRVYGFLGAGATLGQLLASAAALAFGAACKQTGAAGAAVWLLLPAAGLLLLAARACQAMSSRAEAMLPRDVYDGLQPSQQQARENCNGFGGGISGGGDSLSQGLGLSAAVGAGCGDSWWWWRRRTLPRASPSAGPAPPAPPPRPLLFLPLISSHVDRLAEGFRLIAASPYLLAACAFLALNYSTSATLYFLRAAIVSRSGWLGGSDDRIAFFAALNTASAGVIFMTQMTVTGRALTSLGVGPTLLVGPLVSLAGMAFIGLSPSTATIAGVELLRKVVQYSLARPCREVLFTVVSRREKYVAKVVLDTVVQRLGDTAAAAVFEVIGVRLSLGPSAVAVAGLALCGCHIAVSAALGRMYGTRKAAAALAAKQQLLHDL